MKAGLMAAWLAGMGLVGWRMVHKDHRMPVPGALAGVAGMFAVLALISDVYPKATGLAAVTAWGIDVAAFMHALPAGLSGQITTAQQATGQAEGVSI